MINLPESCIVNKRIPKSKFYEKLNVNSALKRGFIDQVDSIIWAYKIAQSKINIDQGADVEEIEVFEINLNQKEIDLNILSQIDKGIPYKILFILKFNNQEKACICYKNSSIHSDYFSSVWYNTNEQMFDIDGSTTDVIYENLVRTLAADKLNKKDDAETLAESVTRAEECKKIDQKIQQLEKKLAKEKQFNKQIEIRDKIKIIKKFYKN